MLRRNEKGREGHWGRVEESRERREPQVQGWLQVGDLKQVTSPGLPSVIFNRRRKGGR